MKQSRIRERLVEVDDLIPQSNPSRPRRRIRFDVLVCCQLARQSKITGAVT